MAAHNKLYVSQILIWGKQPGLHWQREDDLDQPRMWGLMVMWKVQCLFDMQELSIRFVLRRFMYFLCFPLPNYFDILIWVPEIIYNMNTAEDKGTLIPF